MDGKHKGKIKAGVMAGVLMLVIAGAAGVSIGGSITTTPQADPQPTMAATAVLVNEYDLNGDGCVNAADVDVLAAAFGSQVGDPNYDLRCDFNTDGLVDGTDYNLWRPHLGEGCGN